MSCGWCGAEVSRRERKGQGKVRLAAHHVVLVLRAGLKLDRRRAHAVKLAHLRVALQHLQAVLLVRDLERRRRHHAAPAEGARLVARHARLELGRARRARHVVHVLLLRRRRDVQQELRRHHEHVRGDLVARHARLRRLHELVQAERLLLHDRVHRDVVRHRRPDVALRAQAARRKRARQWAATRRGIIAPRIRQKRTPSGCRLQAKGREGGRGETGQGAGGCRWMAAKRTAEVVCERGGAGEQKASRGTAERTARGAQLLQVR